MNEVTFAQLVAYCAALGLPYQAREAEGLVLVALPGRQGTYVVSFRLIEERAVMLARAGGLLTVPPERRGVLADAACDINARILLGAFSLALAEGVLSLDVPLLYAGVGLSQAQVERCLAALGWTLDTYLPTLQRLCWTQATAEEALGVPAVSPLRGMLDALHDADEPRAQSS